MMRYFPDPQERAEVMEMAHPSEEEFEAALAAARAEDDLSRTNVVAKLPAGSSSIRNGNVRASHNAASDGSRNAHDAEEVRYGQH